MTEKIPVPQAASTQPLQKAEAGASLSPPPYGLSFIDNQVAQRRENKTGMSDQLKAGVESLSGISMGDVKVHYNSLKPAQLQAHAYAQGNQIHLGPGQEKHLPHEAWHVVQQKQGRVQPTVQMKEAVPVNDDEGLEQEADVMGAKAAQMKGATPRDGSEDKTVATTVYQGKFKTQRVEYDENNTDKLDERIKDMIKESNMWTWFPGNEITQQQIDQVKEQIRKFAKDKDWPIGGGRHTWEQLATKAVTACKIQFRGKKEVEAENLKNNTATLEEIRKELDETINEVKKQADHESPDEKKMSDGLNEILTTLKSRSKSLEDKRTVIKNCLQSSNDIYSAVKSLKELRPDASVGKAYDAVCWYYDIVSTNTGSSGFANLDVSIADGKITIAGRPGFSTYTKETVKISQGQHRRHIIAWHSIREFIKKSYDASPAHIKGVIAENLESANTAVKQGIAFCMKANNKSFGNDTNYQEELEKLSEIETLKLGLFVMNGNPKNLWPGSGRVNSTINTVSTHIMKAANTVSDEASLIVLMNKWKARLPGATETEMQKRWEENVKADRKKAVKEQANQAPDNQAPAQEAPIPPREGNPIRIEEGNSRDTIYTTGLRIAYGIGQACIDERIADNQIAAVFKDRVRNVLISNYEIDLLGKEKAQNEMLLGTKQEKPAPQLNEAPISKQDQKVQPKEVKGNLGLEEKEKPSSPGKYSTLKPTIDTIHDVLENKVVSQGNIDKAIEDLLTYV